MSESRGFILVSIIVIFLHFTSSRRSPCLPSEKVSGVSIKPLKRCVVPNVKIPYSTVKSYSSILELPLPNGDDPSYYDDETYLLQVKPNRRNGRSKNYCVRISVPRGDKLNKNVQLNCFKKFLGRNGKIIIVKESNSKRQSTSVVKIVRYKFTKKRGKKRPTTKTPETCHTWKPNIRAFVRDGGVNITTCPSHTTLGRLEFGLYNVKLDRMEPNFLTPEGCWAFFSNISDGDYTGTVQLRDCTDCEMYAFTRSPCLTTRHQSAQFSIVTPTTTLPPYTTPPLTCSTWTPKTVRIFLDVGGVNITACPRDTTLGRLEFGLFNVNLKQMEKHFQTPEGCWAFFPNVTHGVYEGTVQLRGCTDCPMYSYTKMPCTTKRFHSNRFKVLKPDEPGKKCNDKETKDKYGSLEADGILVSPTKNNKILVLYQADDKDHLNAVHSFCKILRLCNIEVVMDREQVSEITEYNKEGWTRKQISECSAVVVVLSKGLLEKCKEMRSKTPAIVKSKFRSQAFDDPFFNMSALGLACMHNAHTFRTKTVIFVSFGYGMDIVKDLSRTFPSMVKYVHSVTREPEVSPLYRNNIRTKRALNLQTLKPHLSLEDSTNLEAISGSEAANEFLFHVDQVMRRREDVIMI